MLIQESSVYLEGCVLIKQPPLVRRLFIIRTHTDVGLTLRPPTGRFLAITLAAKVWPLLFSHRPSEIRPTSWAGVWFNCSRPDADIPL